jgi:cysteine desulfurase
MKQVYVDYAAATPIEPRVVERMSQVATEYGNPSSKHAFGRSAEQILTDSREVIAKFINAMADELYFTSTGTESNNLAILGIARANKSRGNHIITSAIEHPSVMNACRALAHDGFEVTYLPVSSDGYIDPVLFKEAIRPTTILASIHLANSEVGVVQDIAELAKLARDHNVIFHTDACQASAFIELDVQLFGVDALTFNGSKLYGPRGIAVLYVRDGISIFPLVYGGGQEQSLRSGTENVPAIAGLALAAQIAELSRSEDVLRIQGLRDALQQSLEAVGCLTNCRTSKRLPNHLSVIVPTTKTDLVAELDRRGIALSSGSACSSRSQADSHVLNAIGLTSEDINKTIRISLGRTTTSAEIKQISEAIAQLQ